jgi:hypothetical protein
MLKHELTNLLHTQGPLADLAYLRPDQVPRRYPFSKALVYHLLNSGDIKSILVHKPNSIRGIRLVSVASIEAYLARLAKEQRNEEFIPAVAREKITGRRGKRGGDTERIADAINHKEDAPVRRGRGRPRKVRLEEAAA